MKTKKLLAILLVVAMATVLCVSAFADTVVTSTTAGSHVKTPLTKAVSKPAETTDGNTYTFTVANTDLGKKNVSTGADTTIEDILSEFVPAFTAPGKYEFTVKETVPTADAAQGISVNDNVVTKVTDSTDGKFTYTETTTYSKAEYKVTALVATNTDAAGNITYYVQSVQAQKIKDDDGNTVEGAPKVDITDSTDTNAFKFNNKFSKKVDNKTKDEDNETTKEQDKQTLEVSKAVAAATGTEESEIPDQEFNFRMTIAFPVNSTLASYTAVVKDKDGNPTTQKVTFTKGSDGKATAVFKLKKGEWLAFNEIETGAVVDSITEDSYPGFTVSGNEGITVSENGGNAIDVTNTFDKNEGTLTGIMMDNLPYIILLIVVLAGLTGYIVSKRRREQE